jgi:cardiolipin synthase A/B
LSNLVGALSADKPLMLKTWETEQVYFDGDHYFEALIKDIDQAQTAITVEMYIFNYDSLGRKLTTHLLSAQMRGVKIEIIVDGIGSYSFYEKLHGLFARRGIAVKMYNPLPFYHPFYGKLNIWQKMKIFGIRLSRLNIRNHRKIVTIDEKIMYVGSFNFTAEHTHFHQGKKWKDMGVRVSGEQVKFGVLNFKRIWKFKDYYHYKKKNRKIFKHKWKEFPLRLNHSLPMRRFLYKDLLRRIKRAQQRIWLTTPYFIPKRRLIRVLGNAAKRGVDVRLLISSKTDVRLFQTLQFFYYPYLIAKGVKIYQYTETVLHAKNYIIDDWTTIGTTNLNHRSFMHDLEVDLVIQDPTNVQLVDKNFLESLELLPKMTIETLKQRPFFDKLLARLFFLFKYWF